MARILVADDEKPIRDIVAFKLDELGHHVIPAGDGEEAMALVAAHHPDLVILDIVMPTLSGLETLDRLKVDPGLRDIPVVILSARARERDVLAGIRHGAADYIVKPFNLDDLAARVERVLRDHGRGAGPLPG